MTSAFNFAKQIRGDASGRIVAKAETMPDSGDFSAAAVSKTTSASRELVSIFLKRALHLL